MTLLMILGAFCLLLLRTIKGPDQFWILLDRLARALHVLHRAGFFVGFPSSGILRSNGYGMDLAGLPGEVRLALLLNHLFLLFLLEFVLVQVLGYVLLLIGMCTSMALLLEGADLR